LDCPSKNHCPNGTTAPCDFASGGTSNKGQGIEVVNIMEALKGSMQATRQGRGRGAEANGQARERGGNTENLKTNTKLAPDGALRNSLMWRYDAGNKGEVRAY
jgi:hypothetical protein